MKQVEMTYTDLKGNVISLAQLSIAELELIRQLKSAAAKAADWASFSNLWMTMVQKFCADQRLTRPQIRQTIAYRICQDLDRRLAVSTGLSEDMLSPVLSRRKHLAINTLEESLHRIGYSLHIAPTTGN